MEKQKKYIITELKNLHIEDDSIGIDPLIYADVLELPEEFRKMIIIRNNSLKAQRTWDSPNYYHNTGLYEIVSGHPFDMYACKVTKEDNLKQIAHVPSSIYGGNVYFDAEAKYVSENEVYAFFKSLEDKSLLAKYKELMYGLFSELHKDYAVSMDKSIIKLIKKPVKFPRNVIEKVRKNYE